jgi:hypothetical protein
MRANRDAGICGAGLPAGYCATWPDGGAEARRSLPGVLQASGAYRKDAGASGGARPKHLGNQRQLLLTGPAAPPFGLRRRCGYLSAVVRCSVSDCSTVVSPLEKRLSLSPAAAQIARFTVLLNLPNVAAHCFPSFDLPRIFPGDAAAKIITAIPLKPAPRVLGVDPPLLTPDR